MFFNYRIVSVWSAPELLLSPKKFPVKEMTSQMDSYSFGVLVWELWHQAIPFDNDINQAEHYVIKEKSRPKIISQLEDLKDDSSSNSDDEKTNNDENS